MKKILILLSLIVLCSCNEWGSYYEAYHEHFITNYFTYNNIDVKVTEIPAVPEWGQNYNYRFVMICNIILVSFTTILSCFFSNWINREVFSNQKISYISLTS